MLESLIDWVSQVNKMISSFNNLSDEYTTLNRNMRALEKELRASWKGYKDHTEKTYEDFRDEILTIVNQWIATIEPTIQDVVVNSLTTWLDDGTLADIINEDVFNMKTNQADFEQAVKELDNFTVSPEKFSGTDFEKVQQAIDEAIATDKGINLSRMYDITGAGSLMIDKPSRRWVTRFVGSGGIIKTDEGYIFDAPKRNTGDIFFQDITFQSSSGAGVTVINGNNIIRVNSRGVSYISVDTIMKTDEFIQSARFSNSHITGGSGSCFEVVGAYDFHFNNNLVEHRENFFTQYTDLTKTHRMLYNVSFRDNVIEGLTGYTFQFGETHSLIIDSNYFEQNAGGYIRWIEDTDYVTGVRIVGNRVHETPDKHAFIILPWRVFTFSTADNTVRNNMMFDATALTSGYVYSSNDLEHRANIDPQFRILATYERQTPRIDEELETRQTTHSHYTRMVKKHNQTFLRGQFLNVTMEFPQNVNLDDLISTQIVSEDIEVLSYFRQPSNRKLLNVRMRNINESDEYVNTDIFVTVLKQDMTTNIS